MSAVPAAPEAPATKQRRVAQALEREIAQGRWPVSGLLPSESQLVARFGVSRHTVRAALATLQSAGLVASQHGLGTRVLRRQAPPEFTPSLESINALAYYARNTAVEVVRVEDVVVTARLAAVLGAAVGSAWCHAQTLRTAAGQALPMGLSSVWVPAMSRRAIQASRQSGAPVFIEVQKANRKMVSEVRQVLGACLPDREQARLLRCAAREPLLRIQRWYRAADGALLEMSETLHPTSRFQYAMSLRHALADGGSNHRRGK